MQGKAQGKPSLHPGDTSTGDVSGEDVKIDGQHEDQKEVVLSRIVQDEVFTSTGITTYSRSPLPYDDVVASPTDPTSSGASLKASHESAADWTRSEGKAPFVGGKEESEVAANKVGGDFVSQSRTLSSSRVVSTQVQVVNPYDRNDECKATTLTINTLRHDSSFHQSKTTTTAAVPADEDDNNTMDEMKHDLTLTASSVQEAKMLSPTNSDEITSEMMLLENRGTEDRVSAQVTNVTSAAAREGAFYTCYRVFFSG